MQNTATITKKFEAEGIKNLQLVTFAGDIEIIGHEENTIIIEVFASVRSFTSLFLNVDNVNFIDADINDLTINTFGDRLQIFSKPNYFNPYNWVNFQKMSFRIFLPKSINTSVKTHGGNIYFKNVNANHNPILPYRMQQH